MGTTYRAANFTRKETIDPYPFKGGVKMGAIGDNTGFCTLLTKLLITEWANEEVALIGDYDMDSPAWRSEGGWKDITLRLVREKWVSLDEVDEKSTDGAELLAKLKEAA